jgi:hypothetical protein
MYETTLVSQRLFGFGTVENGFKKFFCPYNNNRPLEPILTAMSGLEATTLDELLGYQQKYSNSHKYPTVKGGQEFSSSWLKDRCTEVGVDFQGSTKKAIMLEKLIEYYQTATVKSRPFNRSDCLKAADSPQPKNSLYSNKRLQDVSQQLGSPRGTKREMCNRIHNKTTADNSTGDVSVTVDRVVDHLNQKMSDLTIAHIDLVERKREHLDDLKQIQTAQGQTNCAILEVFQRIVKGCS